MKRDPAVFLRDILESIEYIEEDTKNIKKKDFLGSRTTQDLVFRRLEIIGEAVKYLPEEFKDEHRNIPWRKIASLRDVLIHEYFGVDTQRIWETIQKDLPGFKQQVEKLLE